MLNWSPETEYGESGLESETQMLECLDSLVQQAPVRRELDAIADRLKASLAAGRSADLVYQPIDLSLYGATLPPGIRSSWVFALRRNTVSGAERHPDSIQRMMSYRGSGDLQTMPAERWISNHLVSDPDAPLKDRWISIPEGVWHQGVMGNEDWLVVSFHTAAAEDLIEERPSAGEEGTTRRHYLG